MPRSALHEERLALPQTESAYIQARRRADPDYRPRKLVRGPAVWDEKYLTETWAERKARRAAGVQS